MTAVLWVVLSLKPLRTSSRVVTSDMKLRVKGVSNPGEGPHRGRNCLNATPPREVIRKEDFDTLLVPHD